jgi:hypothetical protein
MQRYSGKTTKSVPEEIAVSKREFLTTAADLLAAAPPCTAR